MLSMRLATHSAKHNMLKLIVPFAALVFCLYMLLFNGDYDKLAKAISEKDKMIEMLTNKISCLTTGVLPSGGFCLESGKSIIGGNNKWDGKLCAGLEEIFGHSSVGDLGAGLGHYGNCFLRLTSSGIQTTSEEERKDLEDTYKYEMKAGNLVNKAQVIRSWQGYDSSSNIEKITGGKVRTADLSKPIDLGNRYDWVMSLEVGEHIPAEFEEAFLNNLAKHACKGIVMSWAVPGQGGHHHVNNHDNDYIKQQMALRGLSQDLKSQNHLREIVTVSWFKNTLMVYKYDKKRC